MVEVEAQGKAFASSGILGSNSVISRGVQSGAGAVPNGVQSKPGVATTAQDGALNVHSRVTYPPELQGIVFVRYLDHVAYNRTSAIAMKPQVRRAVGWLVYECEQYVILAWDSDDEPPTLHGGDPKASGLVLLKSDILELKKLKEHILPLKENSKWHLNSQKTKDKVEYAFQPKKRKTQRIGREKPNDRT